jgi:hypothetical protein
MKKLPILAAISVVLAGSAAVSSANIEPNTARNKPRESGVSLLTPEQVKLQEAMIVSDAGRTSISYIRTARRLLHNQQAEQAGQYLTKAKYLLGQIGGLAKYYAINSASNTIKVGGLTKKDSASLNNETGTDKLLPIFGAISIDQHVHITDELKHQLNALSRSLVRGEHEQVIAGLKQAGIATSYTYVDMPYDATLTRVDSAIDALASNDREAADQAMLAIERALHIDKVSLGQGETNIKS